MLSFPFGPTFNPLGSYYKIITRPIGYIEKTFHFFSLPKISLTSVGTVGHTNGPNLLFPYSLQRMNFTEM